MSEELTPLKAFKKLREQNDFLKQRNIPKEYRYDDELDIIETTLKDYEELTNKPVVLYGRTQALIDMICKTHKEIKVINLIDERKVKAFDTIKEKQVDVYILLKTKSLDEYNEWYVGIQDNFMPLTQDEYDLLKEVLL